MTLLLSTSKAQMMARDHLKARRLQHGLTQAGLAKRSGVSLPTLRKFEQQGLISLESFMKLLAVLDALESMVDAIKPEPQQFNSIDEVIRANSRKQRKYGWRT